MSKVTSKLQVTIPKSLATRLDIRPGAEVTWAESGGALRLAPARADRSTLSLEERLRLFDAATERQRQRERNRDWTQATTTRDWTREELYDRGRPR